MVFNNKTSNGKLFVEANPVSPPCWVVWSMFILFKKMCMKVPFNPVRPNSDLSQTSHCNIKGLSVSEVMRIENMITQVKFH